ncbi:MAG TPA: hypothetical protein DHV36_07030 [Desulfobacteraceae bacterium]|nr:hypothetical protein [Desulfobacteraceae bacterium]|tara:strand:- start:1649 stop:2392 length:744 start_codon:yes stop_codon:yes gene_type:complete
MEKIKIKETPMSIYMYRQRSGRRFPIWFGFSLLVFLWLINSAACAHAAETKVSGRLVNGFRILDTQNHPDTSEFTVYRGDYIKFVPGENKPAVLSVPALDIEAELTPVLSDAPYFKMKEVGTFDFFINTTPGTIQVVEYTGIRYQAVSATEAAAIIKAQNPLVLDVRTPREYAVGHLPDVTLIPVQELQRRIGELATHKDAPVLIYCASGNRSTVASKILIDQGFSRIYNLEKGIKGWAKQGLPVVK